MLEPFANLLIGRFMTDGIRYNYRVDVAWLRAARALVEKMKRSQVLSNLAEVDAKEICKDAFLPIEPYRSLSDMEPLERVAYNLANVWANGLPGAKVAIWAALEEAAKASLPTEPSDAEVEAAARAIYAIAPEEYGGESIDGFQVSPVGKLTFEQSRESAIEQGFEFYPEQCARAALRAAYAKRGETNVP